MIYCICIIYLIIVLLVIINRYIFLKAWYGKAIPEMTAGIFKYIDKKDGTVKITGFSEDGMKADITELLIPSEIEGKQVTEIGDIAFVCCDSLKGITISEGVSQIGDYAFDSCESLTKIMLPESVVFIGEGAFLECDNLTMFAPSGSYAERYAIENDILLENP